MNPLLHRTVLGRAFAHGMHHVGGDLSPTSRRACGDDSVADESAPTQDRFSTETKFQTGSKTEPHCGAAYAHRCPDE